MILVARGPPSSRLPGRDRASTGTPRPAGEGAHRGHHVLDSSSNEKDGRSQCAPQLLLRGSQRHARQLLVQGEQCVFSVRPRFGIGPGHLQTAVRLTWWVGRDTTATVKKSPIPGRASPEYVRVCRETTSLTWKPQDHAELWKAPRGRTTAGLGLGARPGLARGQTLCLIPLHQQGPRNGLVFPGVGLGPSQMKTLVKSYAPAAVAQSY